MNIDELLLTDDERDDVCNTCCYEDCGLSVKVCGNHIKAEAIKLLGTLKNKGMLTHDTTDSYPYPCKQTCQLCEIGKILKGDIK